MGYRALAPSQAGIDASLGARGRIWGGVRGFSVSRELLLKLVVIVPTALACLYYGLIATNRYVSESYYVVQSIDAHRASGLEMLFQTFGVARTVDDANAVESYLLSRDAVRALEQRLPIRKMFAREGVDVLARFPRPFRGDSFESLYNYYLDRVSVIHNPSKGITGLKVVAFDPRDAQAIAQALLTLAEEFVNRLNSRSQLDTVKSARDERTAAEMRLEAAQTALTDYRNREKLVDPTVMSVSVLETLTSLSTQLASARAQYYEAERNSPGGPGLAPLADQVKALEAAVAAQRQSIAGDNSALAAKLASYEKLLVDAKLSETELAAASISLQTAQQDARRQSIYLEEIVTPNLPDEATEPTSLRDVATVFVLSFAGASVVWLVMAGAREHKNE